MSDRVIRPATVDDAGRMNEIYNTVIVGSHVSFDTEPWTNDQRKAWLHARVSGGYPVLVAEESGTVVGVAWSGPWRDKTAYRSSVETTVVLDPDKIGIGIGADLLGVLVDTLTVEGFHRAYAIVALPNDASMAVHRKLGYIEIGTLDEAGFKDGRFVSTMILEKQLG